MIPARKCPKCHGFGHWASECTTETLIIFTPDGRVVEVEEQKKPIWDEDPFEESEEPQLQADEETPLLTPEYQHMQFDDHTIEISGGPHFDSEYTDGLVPAECAELQRQINELFAGSLQSDQPALLSYPEQHGVQGSDDDWIKELPQEEVPPSTPIKNEPVMTRAAPLQTRDDETSGDLLEVEPCEMILPTEPQKMLLQILYSNNRPAQQEYKHLPVTDVPKLDLAWTQVKRKKISVGSIGKLRPSVSVLRPDTTTDPEMKAKPPEPRENDRVVF